MQMKILMKNLNGKKKLNLKKNSDLIFYIFETIFEPGLVVILMT